MTDSDNGRVTLAVLGEKLDNIERLFTTHIDDDKELNRDREKRIRSNETAITRLGERQRQTMGVLAFIQLVVGGVAAWLGIRS